MFIVINVIDTNLSLTTSLILYNPSLDIFFPGNIFRWARLYLQYCICPSCAKISSNCLIESEWRGEAKGQQLHNIYLHAAVGAAGSHLTPDIV